MLISPACRKNSPEPQTQTPPPLLRTQALQLPRFTDPRDPRQEWVLDLLRPRLSRLSGLKWICQPKNGSSEALLEISLGNLSVPCEDFLKSNPLKNRKGGLSCTADGSMRISLGGEGCPQDGNPPPLLKELRLPSGHGLYQSESESRLKPRNETLPLIEFESKTASEGRRVLSSPKMATWLAQGGYRGAISLRLEPQLKGPRERTRWNGLIRGAKERLERMVFPKLFRPTPELLSDNTETPITPFIIIHNFYVEPLFKETCDYVSDWTAARQLLDMEPPQESKIQEDNLLEFECRFRWSEESPPDGALSLVSLPLPLVVEGHTDFPFKTLDDALSSSQFQSLKIP